MTNVTSVERGGIGRVSGDGGEAEVTAEELRAMKGEALEVAKAAAYNVNERRFASEETRFCIWEGQSADGRKHAEANSGKAAFPFEGASDGRIRLADLIVNERVLILVAAAVRNVPRVKGLGLQQEGLGHKLTALLTWLLRNHWGVEYVRTIVQLAQYQEGDSPSGAVLGVWWAQETGLELKTVSLADLKLVAAHLLGLAPGGGGPESGVQSPESPAGPGPQGVPPSPRPSPPGEGEQRAPGPGSAGPGVQASGRLAMAQEQEMVRRFEGWWGKIEGQLLNPDRDGDTAGLLQGVLPHVSRERARTMVGELRGAGVARYPSPYLKSDGPAVGAYRVFDDIFFPTNTTSVKRCRVWFVREWLSEVEVRERGVSAGWSEGFIEGVLGQEGLSGWPVYRRNPTQGDFMVIKQEESKEAYRGLYEVNTVYYRAANGDGVPGIYHYPFHFQVEVAGHERRLLEYEHGEYPFSYFSREVLGKRLLDARGVPEIVATEQQALKLLNDSFNDNVSLATLPNIKVPRRRSKLSLVIGPLKVIKEDRPGDVSWMEPPQYPQGNDQQQRHIWRRVNEYFGRLDNELPGLLAQMQQTGMVILFLGSLAEGLTQALQLCQQYMSDEQLAAICGEDGIPVARTREELQGKFSVELSFDPRDLDLEYLKAIGELIAKVILPVDTVGTVQRDKLVQRLFMAIDPNLAAGTLRPVEAASASEVADEEKNFALMASGVEPPMAAEGLNFPLRLQVLTGIVQQNPEAYQKLTPVSREIFGARFKYLENQVQQLKNAQIGRQVGEPVLGGGGGPGGAGGGGMRGISGGPGGPGGPGAGRGARPGAPMGPGGAGPAPAGISAGAGR